MPKGNTHTFETANAAMKALGNRIVESTYKGWNEPCTIIFKDGSKSTKHTPTNVYQRSYISKPSRKHTIEIANARMKALGNKIVESTFKGWNKPCTIIFKDGSKSTKHTPHDVEKLGWKSKPRIGKHTFETANARMKALGNKIVESTFKSWNEPCTIIFSDGSKSTKHSPREVERQGWKSKPQLGEYTFEDANARMKLLENRIVKSTFNGWAEPCTIIFKNGSKSTKHSPREVDRNGWKAKPESFGPDQNTKFLYIMAYIVSSELIAYKIGISKNLKQRKKSIKGGLQKGELTFYKVFEFDCYENCKQAEADVKELTRASESVCKKFGYGKTEVYAADQLKPAMKIIGKYVKDGLCFEYTPD